MSENFQFLLASAAVQATGVLTVQSAVQCREINVPKLRKIPG